MATSFATYASQFLNRQLAPGAASTSTSQPMFFSFTTDDGSRGGYDLDADLDDLDDPHLRSSGASRVARETHNGLEDDDDPYLRLDEDERTGTAGFVSTRDAAQAAPLIPSEEGSSSPGDSPKGWLAHLASPLMRQSRSHTRSPSPTPSHASTDSVPPPDLYGREAARMVSSPPRPPSTGRGPISLSLTQSLLPRDGRVRPLDVFSLPDPRYVPRGRRKYHDSIWTALWCTGVSLCVFFCVILLFTTRKPAHLPPITLPYTTLLHTVPMLTILTFSSAFGAYTHILLLQIFVRPVMFATSVFIPATLFISAIWAFVGSFMWDANTEPTWGETVGLRLFALIPLTLSLLTARRFLHLPRLIHTTSSTLTLTTELLIANPFLLALSPVILLATLLASIPFLTLIFRLLLIGRPVKESSAWEWHVYAWANWSITGVVGVWLWSWGVARGVLRMTCASVIGAWYFADLDAPTPPPGSTHTIHAALARSADASLGTVTLAALILTAVRVLTLLTMFLERLPMYLPARTLFIMTGAKFIAGYLDGVTTALSNYALVYSGLTGDPFLGSARRARALTSSVEARAVREGRRVGVEAPLTLLTIAPLTLTFPYALITYLFVAHTLGAPHEALGAAILAAGVTALVGLFCVGLIHDTADTLYICYCIDKDVGERRRDEVFSIYEYDTERTRQQQRPGQPSVLSTTTIPRKVQQQPRTSQIPSQSQQAHESTQRSRRSNQPPPKPQYMPSESTSHFLPRQPLEPQPLHVVGEETGEEDGEEGLNPFRGSHLEGGKMETSAELNMKSWMKERTGTGTGTRVGQNQTPRPYSVDGDLERGQVVVPRSSMENDDEAGREDEGSQLLPGSGLF